MLSNNDIAKLAKVLATKEDIAEINDRLDHHDRLFDSMLTTLDSLVRSVSRLNIEHYFISHILENHEKLLARHEDLLQKHQEWMREHDILHKLRP